MEPATELTAFAAGGALLGLEGCWSKV